MPLDLEHFFIYAIVLLALAWLFRGLFKKRKAKPGCGGDCGCEGVKRDPTIQQFLDKREP
jgi:hypothetical protein|tara:strand:- start:2808 stop:2987 length:180 start_codon:yes stop_codon:yes gene_type:complete